jgi:hypothetical protein
MVAGDPSHAFGVRERPGLKTQAWHGFSALIEGEFSQAVENDDNGGGGPNAGPFVLGNSVIADPETNALNRGDIQYAGFDTTVKAGRQRIIDDHAAFIGNVGLRQNEQTFDAISPNNPSIDRLTLDKAIPGNRDGFSSIRQARGHRGEGHLTQADESLLHQTGLALG